MSTQASVNQASVSKSGDHFIGYLLVIVLLLLGAGIGGAWYYSQNAAKPVVRNAYVDTGPIVVTVAGYNIATRMSVQTSKADGDWASRNREALSQVMNHALAASDPKSLQTPQGLRDLQAALAEAGNASMKTAKIQNVLLTEFLIQVAD